MRAGLPGADNSHTVAPMMLPHRLLRTCLAAALAVGAGGAIVMVSDPAHANAPFAKTQAPGWYRLTLGDFEVTALSDGTFTMPIHERLTGTTPEKVNTALSAALMKPPFETSINGYLINTGTKLVLIDAGAGAVFGPTVGKLLTSLKAAGYKPEQVDEVYITHMHGDHLGGLLVNGKIAFPKAIVRAGKADADFWLSKETLEKAPAEAKDFIKAAQTALNPYVAAGKFKPIEAEGELVPGIKAIPTPGHTPGHTIYEVQSKGAKLVVWGDLMHVAAIQFPDPSVTISFDSDSKAAAEQRKKVYADAAKQSYFAAIAHVPFPGIGQLRAEGTGYRYFPVNYSNSAPAGK
jgi:glyoxylase-like metal-dependent hydrolase (beta-lactamase superfamily II)